MGVLNQVLTTATLLSALVVGIGLVALSDLGEAEGAWADELSELQLEHVGLSRGRALASPEDLTAIDVRELEVAERERAATRALAGVGNRAAWLRLALLPFGLLALVGVVTGVGRQLAASLDTGVELPARP